MSDPSIPVDQESQDISPSVDINKALDEANLAVHLDDDTLFQIGSDVVEGYESDLQSRSAWEEQNEEWMKLATQVMEKKTWPWVGAANIKFPILSTAALQFAARAYPSLVSGFDIVKAKAIGSDPEGVAAGKAENISTHMSYQLLHEMDDWEEDMDKLCFILPIIGCTFKKTYYSQLRKKNVSELILPKNLIINYWATKLENASRITHEIFLTNNEIKERQNAEIYLTGEKYDDLVKTSGNIGVNSRRTTSKDEMSGQSPTYDKTTPRLILEQHTFLDLDKDDYYEPYIVTVDYETRKVVRIAARWEKDGVKLNDEGKLIKIDPCHYFTKFSLLPNPDGGFYDLGFGLLLGGINDACNTILNQLVDAGTLANLQGGFISKGIRISQGDMKIAPGQWQQVNNFGDDLKKGIFPLPFKEPSTVLFSLLEMLVQSGKELASIAEIMVGKTPGQNTPATTTMATIEQGLKVFTAIYKRIYRALGQEFEKLYRLNQIHMPETVDFSVEVAGAQESRQITKQDYQSMPMQGQIQTQGKPFVKIIPAADPNMVSETQKLVKSQGLLELIQLGTINPQVATQHILEHQGQADIKTLMQMPEPQPPLEVQIEQMKIAATKEIKDQEAQLQYMKIMAESMERKSKSALNWAQAQVASQGQALEMARQEFDKQVADEDRMFNYAQMQLDHYHQNEDRKVAQQQADAAKQKAQQPQGG